MGIILNFGCVQTIIKVEVSPQIKFFLLIKGVIIGIDFSYVLYANTTQYFFFILSKVKLVTCFHMLFNNLQLYT